MEVRRITNIAEVLKCLPFEREIRKKGRDNSRESQLLLFVESQLNNPYFAFFIAYDRENIVGYCVAFVSIIQGIGNRIHISRWYAKEREVFEALERSVREWIRPYNVKIAQITAVNHIKAIQRRYKFNPVSICLERRI